MAYASSTAGAGRGGRSVREETRTCWYCFQAGHLKANCHIWQTWPPAANVVTEHTTHVAAAGLKYPPGLIAHAQALLSKPRKAPTRRYSI
ncbi:hypothetical protein N7524_000373 [Penicillium chrysogenum]|nr:hypothetical protein N7524_000373 [Penicillium chrysogenum]